MTDALLLEGMTYAEGNFLNENAPHLKVDKKLIKERFDLTGKKVLDFGCGMGGMSLWYANTWDCDVYGLDIDQHHIDIANRLKDKHQTYNVQFERRDVLENPLDEQYDFIFMNDVAEHIPIQILRQIFQQFALSLKPDGVLFVTYPPWKSPYASHVNHVIKLPWVQFLPQPIVRSWIKSKNHSLVGDLESDLVSAYEGLNHLTHKKLMAVANEARLTLSYRKSHAFYNKWSSLKNLQLRFFPFDFLITKEFAAFKM
ncbi:MAG: class I SAM-dependent methyltransferase [Saprospiraceae bacterium]|nr:class I SAM-dependent methyltransferase [Saprospiraceae bacterium]